MFFFDIKFIKKNYILLNHNFDSILLVSIISVTSLYNSHMTYIIYI